ncbi:hypothetical protein NCCP2140_18860 [Pseudoalteromonas sp. NCCP-2140]|nr:hypothetical protein NCCP2140_18860 [Pseudoalteromonas sp. NCCP-2140]
MNTIAAKALLILQFNMPTYKPLNHSIPTSEYMPTPKSAEITPIAMQATINTLAKLVTLVSSVCCLSFRLISQNAVKAARVLPVVVAAFIAMCLNVNGFKSLR